MTVQTGPWQTLYIPDDSALLEYYSQAISAASYDLQLSLLPC